MGHLSCRTLVNTTSQFYHKVDFCELKVPIRHEYLYSNTAQRLTIYYMNIPDWVHPIMYEYSQSSTPFFGINCNIQIQHEFYLQINSCEVIYIYKASLVVNVFPGGSLLTKLPSFFTHHCLFLSLVWKCCLRTGRTTNRKCFSETKGIDLGEVVVVLFRNSMWKALGLCTYR